MITKTALRHAWKALRTFFNRYGGQHVIIPPSTPAVPAIKLIITQEVSKGGKNGNDTIFYIREAKPIPGRTFEATALTYDAALWQIKQLPQGKYELAFKVES